MKSQNTLHALFEKQALAHPKKIAIKDNGVAITYAALNQEANYFAEKLISLGITENDVVPILADKSIPLITSILGILKTNAAYLILHNKHPEEIRKTISNKINPKVICTDSMYGNLLPKNISNIVKIDDTSLNPKSKVHHGKKFQIRSKSDDRLAYILYTSGTTGHPKGVMVSHNNLITIYHGWEKAYQLNSNDTHLQMANPGFDVFSGDILRALLSGSTLVLCHENTLLDAKALYELIEREKITVAEFVPTTLRNLLTFLSHKKIKFTTFRMLICGSDQWTMGEYRDTKKFLPSQARLINSYGLTETTIDSTFFESDDSYDFIADHSIVPIGKPFDGVKIKCMKDNKSINNPGEVGELVIGGSTVSSGYFKEPEMSKKFFKKELENGKTRERWFYTGDFVYYLPSGDIAMVGRNKNHIKIHGQRVDILAVEFCINHHPNIAETLVLPVTSQENGTSQQLAAFIKFSDDNISCHEIRSYLKRHLPAYSIPSYFYRVDQISTNLNGKIIRKFDVQKENIIEHMQPAGCCPKNSSEKKLLEIWKEVLGIDSVGVDQFFKEDLGGQSLDFLLMIEKINQRFSLNLPCTMPDCTIKNLAKKIFLYKDINQINFWGDNNHVSHTIPFYRQHFNPINYCSLYNHSFYSPKKKPYAPRNIVKPPCYNRLFYHPTNHQTIKRTRFFHKCVMHMMKRVI
jgi:amino acid adenylation domain-containing protein